MDDCLLGPAAVEAALLPGFLRMRKQQMEEEAAESLREETSGLTTLSKSFGSAGLHPVRIHAQFPDVSLGPSKRFSHCVRFYL